MQHRVIRNEQYGALVPDFDVYLHVQRFQTMLRRHKNFDFTSNCSCDITVMFGDFLVTNKRRNLRRPTCTLCQMPKQHDVQLILSCQPIYLPVICAKIHQI